MQSSTLTARQQRERDFFNASITSDYYGDWQEFPYESWRVSHPAYTCALDFLGEVKGKRLLICGIGSEAILFARAGAEVWGFDIAKNQISSVRHLASRCGLADSIHTEVMSFESMTYPDGFFDLAWGAAILHHIDLLQGRQELRRVLNGRASFLEPLGENPFLQFARNYLPYREKGRTEDERPLVYADVDTFASAFPASYRREFSLLGMLERRVVKSRRIIRRLRAADSVLLARVPALRRWCSQIWIGISC